MKRFMIVAMCVFCCVFIFSPVVVLSAPVWQMKFRDDDPVVIGTDSDFYISYDEATDNRLEISDGTNLLSWLTDGGTTGNGGVTGSWTADSLITGTGYAGTGATITNAGVASFDGTVTTGGSFVTTGGLIEDTDNEDLVIRTNANANQVVLDSAGNVGIGTTSPANPLHIFHPAESLLCLQRSATNGDSSGILFKVSSNTQDLYKKAGIFFERDDAIYARGSLHFAVDSAADFNNVGPTDAKLTIFQNGSVGIGGDIDLKGGDLSNSTGTTVTIPEDVWTGVYEATDHSINLRSGAANDAYLNFYEADANNGGVMWHDGGDEALYIGTRNASATPTGAIKIADGSANVTILGGVTTSGSWDNNGENVYLGSHGASFEGLRINVVNSTGECFLLPEDDDDGLVFGIKPQTANNGDAEIAFFPTDTAINGTGLGKFIVYDPGTTTETFKVMADTGVTSLGGKIDKYNNVATEGYGVGAIVDNVALTEQTGTVASVACSNAGTAGQYRVDYYLVVTTTEAGDSVAANITWNDGTAARTVTSSSVATDATNYTQGSVYCRLGSGSVAYSTTYTGTRTTAIYSLYLTCTRLN